MAVGVPVGLPGFYVEVLGKGLRRRRTVTAAQQDPAFTGFSRLQRMPVKDASIACIA
jgi:hypothetical protein